MNVNAFSPSIICSLINEIIGVNRPNKLSIMEVNRRENTNEVYLDLFDVTLDDRRHPLHLLHATTTLCSSLIQKPV